MLKSFARTAGFLAYLFITLEMLFMVTPFALYYYSAYAPLLSAPSNLQTAAWLPAFFLPHLSTEIVPSIGGLIFLVGLLGFLLGAFQIYYAKFRRHGVVKSGLYRRVRHPQYLFLALAGLGLLIVWPRFILLVIYVHMLWFYYLLARSEEERMQSCHGDVYLESMRDIPMFIPGTPGGHLSRLLFGWISGRRLRLFIIYCVSVVASIGGAFALRQLSLRLTTHLNLSDEKMAAVSFLSSNGMQLRELIQSARSDREVQDRLPRQDGWLLVQAADGKASVVHVMIDAGMTPGHAKNLPLAEKGIKLVFLQRKDQHAQKDPFEAGARWQPVFIAELDGRKVSHILDLAQALFQGNPLMPVF
jgi:protein-S-isoprenylcysteine O-methyltransferase Ste14